MYLSQKHVITEISNNILTITLNRPESLNAFSAEMLLGITDALKDAQNDPDVRTIIIKGSGKAFCAGGDINSMNGGTLATYDFVGILNECILTIKDTEKPIIAVVHGYAAGAGTSLALATDLIIAEEGSKFAFSYSQVGLSSDGGGSYFITNLLGPYLAKQFYFNAEPIPVERLSQFGIINDIVPAEKLEETVMNVATKLANGPSRAYGIQKKLINQALTASLEEVLEQERVSISVMALTEDHREGVTAFKEKRKPKFIGQ